MKLKIIIPIITVAILATAIILGFNLTETEPKPEPKNYDDIVISLERTGCQVPCPVYSVTIFEDGTVIYEGKQHVQNVGTYQYHIPRYNVERLIDKFHQINYFALDDSYTKNTFDLQTVTTTFQTDSYKKTVSNYGGAGPESLKELEQLIDRFAGSQAMNEITVPENQSITPSIYDMKPNSMEWFYYPNPENTEDRDPFHKFILIRLPEWLGGDQNNTSAFRAYSAVSLTDHCLVKYWPQPERQRMENPCRGEMYRPIDGAMIVRGDPITVTTPMALPYLELSIENEMLYIEPPTWTPQKNGVISIGKELSIQQIRQNSKSMIDSFEKNYPQFPKIPLTIGGYTLATISHGSDEAQVRYFGFSTISGYRGLSMSLASAQDQQYFLNFAMPDSEFWQLGDNIIRITANDRSYKAEFFKDGYKISITGDNSEFMRKEIVNNYFPEYDHDEMFMISRNMK